MRGVICGLFQDHVDLRAEREEGVGDVAGAAGVVHGSLEAGPERPLATCVPELLHQISDGTAAPRGRRVFFVIRAWHRRGPRAPTFG